MPDGPRVICLTPVKNEKWILDRFLRAASLWADEIVIADQGSNDGSREIAKRRPKTRIVENPAAGYSEAARQSLLVNAARETDGPRVMIALDADEMLSANAWSGAEWQEAMRAPPGTAFDFRKIDLCLQPDRYFFDSVADGRVWHPLGYVDDGAEHEGRAIHSCRFPVRADSPRFRFQNTVVLHFQFCSPARMASKHRWYRCYERLTFPEKTAVEIHRQYDWMERLEPNLRPCPREWFEAYEEAGVDLATFADDEVFWWDWEILRMFAEHGVERFRDLDIWSVDWEALRKVGFARGFGGLPDSPVRPPLRARDRFGLGVLRRAKRIRGRRWIDRAVDRLLAS